MQFGISEAVRHWALYKPGKLAAFFDGREVSFRELDDDVGAVSSFLKRIAPEERRVGVCCQTKYPLLVLALGTIRMGKSVVLLNSGLSQEFLSQSITEAGIKTVIHDRGCPHFLSAPSSSLITHHSIELDELKAIETNDGRLATCFPDDEWGVFYSSGTTGIPKGIERNHYSIITELLGWCLELGLCKNTHFYIGRPVYYTGGCVLTLATWLVGGSVGLDRDVDWDSYQKHLSLKNTTYAFFFQARLKNSTRRFQEETIVYLRRVRS